MNALSEKIVAGPEKETRSSLVDNKLRGAIPLSPGGRSSDPEDKRVTTESTIVPNNGRCTDDSRHSAVMEARKCPSNASKHEWVEQYEQGVYISLAVLPNGQQGLKRVRFR